MRTLQQAREFVRAARICTVFAQRPGLACLWTVVDLPEKQPGERGWGEKIGHVWRWKNELPARYPEEIFYGKIRGGHAVLMTLDYLTQVHYPQSHVPVPECTPLARRLHRLIRSEPRLTGDLRREAMAGTRCTRAAFEGALKELQVTLNVVRSNDPEVESDLWLPFEEQYPGLTG